MSRKIGAIALALLALAILVGCEQTPQGTYTPPSKDGKQTTGGPAQGSTEP